MTKYEPRYRIELMEDANLFEHINMRSNHRAAEVRYMNTITNVEKEGATIR